MHSIIRDERGRLVPVVRPKRWLAASVKRSRDRTDRIMRSRKQRKARLARTQWVGELDRRGICELEAIGIEWRSVEHWLDALDPRETFVARMVVKQVLQTLADDKARSAERFEARRELYRRLIAAGCVD
jgi:DNA-binding transcriptional ArsR family regulator